MCKSKSNQIKSINVMHMRFLNKRMNVFPCKFPHFIIMHVTLFSSYARLWKQNGEIGRAGRKKKHNFFVIWVIDCKIIFQPILVELLIGVCTCIWSPRTSPSIISYDVFTSIGNNIYNETPSYYYYYYYYYCYYKF